MSMIVARLEVTQDDEGNVHVEGSGPLLKHKAFAYGLLELAKDVIRGTDQSRVQPAGLGDLPHRH